MLTRKNLKILLKDIPQLLSGVGVSVDRMVLFGSYAIGNVGPYSDVDIAIWSPQFTGFGLKDLDLFKPLLRKYPMLDIKPFASGTTLDDDPFLEIIEQTGQEIYFHEEEIGIE